MAVLLILVALIAPGFAQFSYYSPCPCSSPSPSPSPCPSPSPSPYPSPSPSPCPSDPCDNDYDFHTQYINFVLNNGDGKQLDNMCMTFIPNNVIGDTYQLYISKVYCDGSSTNESFVIQYNSTGDYFNIAAPTCLFQSSIIARVGETAIFASTVIGGNCVACDGSQLVYPVLGGSRSPTPLTSCELDQIQQILSENGFGCGKIQYLPMRQNFQCITTQASSSVEDDTYCPTPSYVPSYPNYPSYNYYDPSAYSTYSTSYYSPPCGCQYTY